MKADWKRPSSKSHPLSWLGHPASMYKDMKADWRRQPSRSHPLSCLGQPASLFKKHEDRLETSAFQDSIHLDILTKSLDNSVLHSKNLRTKHKAIIPSIGAVFHSHYKNKKIQLPNLFHRLYFFNAGCRSSKCSNAPHLILFHVIYTALRLYWIFLIFCLARKLKFNYNSFQCHLRLLSYAYFINNFSFQ